MQCVGLISPRTSPPRSGRSRTMKIKIINELSPDMLQRSSAEWLVENPEAKIRFVTHAESSAPASEHGSNGTADGWWSGTIAFFYE